MATKQADYSQWSNENLIQRVQELEEQLKTQTLQFKQASATSNRASSSPLPTRSRRSRSDRVFDPSKYSTRHIALKFAYLGQRYNGFEHHANNTTPLPTIEEELWKAFMKSRLIFPVDDGQAKPGEVNWEGCDYSKCGRTDKGVSAFGQVIGIRVRSNRPLGRKKQSGVLGQSLEDGDAHETLPRVDGEELDLPRMASAEDLSDDSSTSSSFDPVNDELPYAQILNRILPEDIRILAWCPSPPPDFSARFSCRERRYRYFFTQPAFAPVPGASGLFEGFDGAKRRDGWLDIDAMREGARQFLGLHDFRNFCKVDASKQITNFERRIFHADIEEIDPFKGPVGYIGGVAFAPAASSIPARQQGLSSSSSSTASTTVPKVYTFTLHGSAFLWHQVRHMVAILFLIGQGLESPSLVSELLDVKANPAKPMYEMATDAPLVLWDCIFPAEGSESREDALGWVYVGDERGMENGKVAGRGSARIYAKHGVGGVVDDVWRVWRRRKIDEVLAGTLLDVVADQGEGRTVCDRSSGRAGSEDAKAALSNAEAPFALKAKSPSQSVFDGGNGPNLKGLYTPVMRKRRMETVEVINARYAVRKGIEGKVAVAEANEVNE
ncbi:MAG: hypothetical protein M1819_001514 [Sarea resinae]|nr:MAG: hypothetical protein M1819_001514 [Sarea resinae]